METFAKFQQSYSDSVVSRTQVFQKYEKSHDFLKWTEKNIRFLKRVFTDDES